MSAFLKEFRDFVNRGNVVDLAVAVVLGIAFGLVVTSFVDDVLMQIVAAIFGEPDFSSLTIDLGDAEIRYGAFLNAVISFLIVAFAVFLVIKTRNALQSESAEAKPAEIDVLIQIRDDLRSRG